MNAFLDRPLSGDWPYLWLDATYLKQREGGRLGCGYSRGGRQRGGAPRGRGPAHRPKRGRLYGSEIRNRLAFIRRSRELGFTLDEIRNLLGLVEGGYTCGEVRDAALTHLRDIRSKIADLRRMERTLAETAARCEGGTTPECPIIDVLSAT